MASDQARSGTAGPEADQDRREDQECSGEYPAAPRSGVQPTPAKLGAARPEEGRVPAPDAIAEARQRVTTLKGLERQVFHAFATLDHVLEDARSVSLVNPCVAIGFELRPNTVHQHLSRARQKLFPGIHASQRQADRLLVAPPEDVVRAGRAYVDVVAAHPGVAKAWADAHEHHAEQRQASKAASAAAADKWHAFLHTLDGSAVQPRDVRAHLRRTGDEPRILEWIPAPSAAAGDASTRRWTAVLDGLPRPTGTKRAGWAHLVAEHAFSSLERLAFEVFEARSACAEQALATLNDAWCAWLAASERMPVELRAAKNQFRERIQAWCLVLVPMEGAGGPTQTPVREER